MAKIKTGIAVSAGMEDAGLSASAIYQESMDLRDGAQKKIPLGELEFFPGNWTLTGRLDEKKRSRIKADILAKGLREPLQAWPTEGHLYVVSGNERLEILRELSPEELFQMRLESVPVIIKHFRDWPTARYHVVTINEDRKAPAGNAPKKVLGIWPVEEFPLLYADLRGNHSRPIENVKIPGGFFTLPQSRRIEELREAQGRFREEVRVVTGWSEAFVAKTVRSAWAIFNKDKASRSAKHPAISAVQSLRKKAEGIRGKDREQLIEEVRQVLDYLEGGSRLRRSLRTP